jgi:predicted nucleotidyltransferase component of viral defense system
MSNFQVLEIKIVGGLKLIDLNTLKRIAKTKGINNIGFAEKDYFQEIILLSISREAPKLVFKGGTALYKIYGLNRFSEDLDFSGEIDEPTARRITQYLQDFGYETEISIKEIKMGTLLTFVTQGFLFQGRAESLARVQMDVNLVNIELKSTWPQFFSLYPDIPSFKLQVMSLEEIAAEKVRAMLVRKKARDLYDIWFLLSMGVIINQSLVNKKLELYKLKFSKRILKNALQECEKVWLKELKPLVIEVPMYEDIRDKIEELLI